MYQLYQVSDTADLVYNSQVALIKLTRRYFLEDIWNQNETHKHKLIPRAT